LYVFREHSIPLHFGVSVIGIFSLKEKIHDPKCNLEDIAITRFNFLVLFWNISWLKNFHEIFGLTGAFILCVNFLLTNLTLILWICVKFWLTNLTYRE